MHQIAIAAAPETTPTLEFEIFDEFHEPDVSDCGTPEPGWPPEPSDSLAEEESAEIRTPFEKSRRRIMMEQAVSLALDETPETPAAAAPWDMPEDVYDEVNLRWVTQAPTALDAGKEGAAKPHEIQGEMFQKGEKEEELPDSLDGSVAHLTAQPPGRPESPESSQAFAWAQEPEIHEWLERSESRESAESTKGAEEQAPPLRKPPARATPSSSHKRGPEVFEPHYSPAELAQEMSLSVNFIRNLFKDEHGVIIILRPEELHKRTYSTIRIPRSVALRVFKTMRRA